MLKLFKKNKDAIIPTYKTSGSAGFDLSACLSYQASVKGYSTSNDEFETFVCSDSSGNNYIDLVHGWRYLIPTGLIMDIPQNHYVSIFSRSGISVKKGLTLINSVGIIDEDYVQEVMIPIVNLSQEKVRIYHGDRIAQGMVNRSNCLMIEEILEKPNIKSERTGGFGSTGV